MKEFEKFLTELPKPAVEVPEFRAQLRRELLSVTPEPCGGRWRAAAMGLAALATTFLVVLGLFVARPEIPAGLHARLTGSYPVEGERFDALEIDRLVGRPGTPLEEDRAFVDSWVARQAGPLAVRSMNDERLLSVRQFELTDGKRMLVFTELGDENSRPRVIRAGSAAQFY